MKRGFNLTAINWEHNTGDLSIIFTPAESDAGLEMDLVLIPRDFTKEDTLSKIKIKYEKINRVCYTKVNLLQLFNDFELKKDVIYDFYYSVENNIYPVFVEDKIFTSKYTVLNQLYKIKPYTTADNRLAIFIVQSHIAAEITKFKQMDHSFNGEIILKSNDTILEVDSDKVTIKLKKRKDRTTLEYDDQISVSVYQENESPNLIFYLNINQFNDFDLKENDVWDGFIKIKSSLYTTESRLIFNYNDQFSYVDIQNKPSYKAKPFKALKNNFGVFISS